MSRSMRTATALTNEIFAASNVPTLVWRSPRVTPAGVAGLWRQFKSGLFDPYRPELHYMRGPGLKWREKHARSNGLNRVVQ
jgi:hypothetical protein